MISPKSVVIMKQTYIYLQMTRNSVGTEDLYPQRQVEETYFDIFLYFDVNALFSTGICNFISLYMHGISVIKVPLNLIQPIKGYKQVKTERKVF